jgi:hypothetical protein
VNTGSEKSGWVDRRVGDGDADAAADADASAAGEGAPPGSEVQVTSRIRAAAAATHRDPVAQEPLAALLSMTVIQLMMVSVTCQNRMLVFA